MKIAIKKVEDGSFVGEEGTKVAYYWVKGTLPDGFTIRFGTRNKYTEGKDAEVDLEQRQFRNGKLGYVEA